MDLLPSRATARHNIQRNYFVSPHYHLCSGSLTLALKKSVQEMTSYIFLIVHYHLTTFMKQNVTVLYTIEMDHDVYLEDVDPTTDNLDALSYDLLPDDLKKASRKTVFAYADSEGNPIQGWDC